jgi:hypothetical protein
MMKVLELLQMDRTSAPQLKTADPPDRALSLSALSSEIGRAMGWEMQFLKGFLRNLALLAVIAVGMYFIFPEQMTGIFEVWGAVIGPVGILVIIVFALPRRKRS